MAFSNQPLRLLVIASAILTFAANVSGQTSKSTAALEGDPFYRAPRGLRRAAPGSILRYRDVPSPIVLNTTKIPMEHAWQILYRTQNSAGKPEAALMTLIKPNNAKSGHLFSQSYFTVRVFAIELLPIVLLTDYFVECGICWVTFFLWAVSDQF